MTDAPHTGRVGAVLMAAGAGSRFGGRPKALLEVDGRPLLARVVQALTGGGVDVIAVVLGHHAGPIGARLDALSGDAALARVALLRATNPTPDAGPGSSLRAGLAALPPALDTVLVALADQPLLRAEDVAAVLQAWRGRSEGVALVAPRHGGDWGHPVAFGPVLRATLAGTTGERGLRDWRRDHPRQVAALQVEHARHTFDLDSEADLARLSAEHGLAWRWPADA